MFWKHKKEKYKQEQACSAQEFVSHLRELADAIEQNKASSIKLAGETVEIPKHAKLKIEHESKKDKEEIELQLKWNK
jgi:amphi-Trp domain-containing protein